MVADCFMGLLPDPVSSVVAVGSFHCGVFVIGLAAPTEKGKSKDVDTE